ncbi:MAG: Maf family protein [Patescibacteria group bacterium]
MKIILASSSPRRSELLRKLVADFEIRIPEIDERLDRKKSATANAEFLATEKARAVFEKNSVTIGGDTLGELAGKILGKPRDKREAAEFLRALAGKQHAVISGFCVKTDEREIVGHAKSLVEFTNISDAAIEKYVAENPVENFAAGYAIQSLPKNFVQKIDGAAETVIGFPLQEIGKILRRLRVGQIELR